MMLNLATIFSHPLKGSPGSTVRIRELAISLYELGVNTSILSPFIENGRAWDKVNTYNVGKWFLPSFLSNFSYDLTRGLYYNKWFVKNLFSNHVFQNKIAKTLSNSIVDFYATNHPDVIQVECPPDMALFAGLDVSKLLNIPVVVDFHNIEAEEYVGSGIVEKDSKYFHQLRERTIEALKFVDAVVVVSDLMRDYVINELKASSSKVFVVPPGGRLRQRYPLRKSPSAIFSGLVSYREHVELFIKAMPMILKRMPNAEFYISNIGEELKHIRNMAKSLRINPNFFWLEGIQDFYKFLSSNHVGVIPSSKDLARQMGTPVKLFDYMSVGLPIVTNNIGGWSEFIRKEEIGLVVDDDFVDFADAIIEVMTNSSLSEKFRNKMHYLVEKEYNWDNSARKLLEVYKKIM